MIDLPCTHLPFEDFRKTERFFKRAYEYNPKLVDTPHSEQGIHVYEVDGVDYYIFDNLQGVYDIDFGGPKAHNLLQAERMLYKQLLDHDLIGDFVVLPSVECVIETYTRKISRVDEDTGYIYEIWDIEDVVSEWWEDLSQNDFATLGRALAEGYKKNAPIR